MTKLLVVFGVLFGILYFFYYKFKKFLTNITGQFEGTQGSSPHSVEQRVDKGKMIKCPSCGVYFPENSGVKKMLHNGELYCSKQCADKGKSQ